MKSLLTILFIVMCSTNVSAFEIDQDLICRAIYITEGGKKAHTPFGIESVTCDSFQECQQICYNTVKNNYKRFLNDEGKEDFIYYLGSKYCPYNTKGWSDLVKWFLYHPKRLNERYLKARSSN